MFELSEEHRMVRDSCRAFARTRLAPVATANDRERRFPAAEIAELGKLGMLGIDIDPEWGGAGLDKVAYAIAVEELSHGCASTGSIVSVHALYGTCVAEFGTHAQRREFLHPFAKGLKIGAFALTEPDCGSDAAAVRTLAERDGDEWVLTGTKAFVSNSPEASGVIVFARAAPYGAETRARRADLRDKAVTAFLVPLPCKGLQVGPPQETMGLRAASCNAISLEGCRIPARHMLGELGQGFKIAMFGLDRGRIGMAAQAVGIARAAFELALTYSRERVTFGKPIGQHQAIQLKLADMATRIDAARLLVWRAAARADAGQRCTAEAAMAKLQASETATFVAHQAIQILGGYGFTTAFAAERFYRDARVTEIYEGTSEILRIIIGRDAFLNG